MWLHLQTAMFENGHLRLPREAPWLAEYVAELTGFPGTKFDDQIDSTTRALQSLKSGFDLAVWEGFAKNVPQLLFDLYGRYRLYSC